MDPLVVGRDSLVEQLAAIVDTGGCAVVVAPPASGLSVMLRAVARATAQRGHDVRFLRFPDERFNGQDGPDGASPTLLVVDDVHRATELQILSLRDRALVAPLVIGARSGVVPEAMSWLWRSGQAERVELGALDARAVQVIVEHRLGAPAHGSLTAGIMKRCAGRPGFVVDEVEAMRLSGAALEEAGYVRDHPTGRVGLPLVERAEDLLGELPLDVADSVRVLALAGALPVDSLHRFGIDLQELVRRGLVDRFEPGERSVIGLVPPALAVAVRATLSPAYLADTAKIILDTDGADLALEDSARLRLQLGIPLDLSEIAAAAWAAVTDRALTSAVALARNAATAGPVGMMVAAEIFTNVGNRVEAAEYYAAVLADDAADPFIRARAATEYASSLLWDLGRPHEAVRIASDLTAQTKGTPFAGVATIHEAGMLVYAGRPRSALDLLGAVDPGELDDPWRRVLCLVRLLSAAFVEPSVPLADDVAELTLVTELRLGETFGPAVGVIAVELAHELMGDIVDAVAVVGAARDDARLHRTPLSAAWLALAEARSELATGRPGPAKRAALDSAASFADINHPSGLRWAIGAALLASALAGDRAGCETYLATLDSLATGAPFLDADLVRARAWAAAVLGNSADAATLFGEAAAMAAAVGSPALEALALHDSYRVLGSAVGRRLDELNRSTPVPSVDVRARHVRLTAAESAVELLELSVEIEQRGAWLLAAEVAGDAAAIAAVQGRRSLAREAKGRQARLVMACGGPVTPRTAGNRTNPLTNRERDIALRAAAGRSSKGIADDLGLSARTVDNVLQRVYIKLGIHGRADLASAAMLDAQP
jgi:DNA-binding CsgD family transcriptional regulator